MSATALVPYLALGLAGSLHCAGMCGPLALSFALARGAPRSVDVLCYVVGKAAMYAVLALLAQRSVLALGAREASWVGASRAAFAVLAAGVMICVALSGLGWLHLPRWKLLGPLEGPWRAAVRGSDELPLALRGLAFGAANGLLPCGLSWSAIALGAAEGGAGLTLAGPFAFGLATGPLLGGLALGATRIPIAWRARGARVAAVGLLLYGGWMLVRGLGSVVPQTGAKVLPECCREVDISSPETD
ncbi:MAG: sulfite exporter TauE/SafE family protein [Planctomycetes bacterium]|nr:sulfite exporter TauE/SafE family protein [Planctomycetota bacterium]